MFADLWPPHESCEARLAKALEPLECFCLRLPVSFSYALLLHVLSARKLSVKSLIAEFPVPAVVSGDGRAGLG